MYTFFLLTLYILCFQIVHISIAVTSGGAKRHAEAGLSGAASSLSKAKTKVLRPSPPSSTSSSASMSMPSFQENVWETYAIDCDPSELKNRIEDAETSDNQDMIEGLLLGAVKNLKNQRAKPDPVLYLTLMYLSKSRDYLFLTKDIIEAICSLLKRDVKEAYKSKGNALVSVLSANLLMSGNFVNFDLIVYVVTFPVLSHL